MAEEPQPPTVREGADPPDVLPANAEDRKAAQAMNSLDAKVDDDSAAPKKEVDAKALAEAMKYLSVGESSAAKKEGSGGAKKKEVEAPKPLIKVEAADVALLVEHCDLSRTKATEVLRAHGADVEGALRAWVTAGV